jgi:hypothetical protein
VSTNTVEVVNYKENNKMATEKWKNSKGRSKRKYHNKSLLRLEAVLYY